LKNNLLGGDHKIEYRVAQKSGASLFYGLLSFELIILPKIYILPHIPVD